MSTPENDTTTRTEAPAARVRHLHAACQLLSLERGAASDAAPAPAGPTAPAHAPGLVRAATAALVLFGVAAALAVALWPGGRVERVADHRLGARAADAELSDALFDPATGRVVVATRGGGLHTLEPNTSYWRRVGRDTTGGLPSDDIVRLARGDDGHIYVLYESDGARGLGRANPAFTEWQNLVGVTRFPELTAPDPARVTSVATVEGRLWVATDRAGVGVYDTNGRGWVARHRAGDGALPDDHVHDLLVAPDGALWAATGGGIARYRGEAWERFGVPELAGKDVRRLRWREGMLWYATAGGGMGRFGGEKWETLAAESGWGESGDADVLRACLDAGRERVWLAGAKTLGGYDLGSRSWVAPVPAPGAVAVMAAGGKGGPPLWAATGDGLFALKADAAGWDGPAFPKQKVVAIDAAGATTLVAVETSGGPHAAFAGGGTEWRKLTGGGRADVGPRGVLAACLRPDGKVVVGTERGVSVYDPAVRDWIGDHAPGADKDNPLAVIDLVPDGERVIALTADAAVRAWDTKADEWSVLAGGGRFPGALADVSAVTRDAAGRLWLAARGKGLHRYDPAARSWADAKVPLKDVAALAASADGVWALGDGGVHLIAEGQPAAAVKVPLARPTRLFAAPGSPGAVVLDAEGRVALLGPAGGAVVVGDAAPGLDPAKITAAGVLGDTAVLGGAKAPTFRYDAAARSWSRVPVEDVTQVVPALGSLWLLGPQSKVYALAATPTDLSPPGVTVSSLAGAADQLVALAADGSAWSLAEVGPKWRVVRAAPAGPTPGLLADPKLAVAAAGDDLYLADAAKLWHFNWPGQRWLPVAGPDGRPLAGGPLVHAHGRLFTLVGGKVYSAAPADAKAREEAVAATQLRLAGTQVAAVVPRESVSLYQNGKWAPVFGAVGRGLLVGDAPVDAVAVPGEGVLVLGSKGAAVVSEGLSGWAPVAGTAVVERVQAGRDGVVWGVGGAGQISLARKGNDGWRWAAVPFPKDAAVAALTVGGGARGDAHWATLADGAVYRLSAGAGPKVWRQPSQAPGRPADLIAAAPTADGFLVAFRGGELAHYRTGPRTWTAVEAPKTNGVARLFALRTPAASSHWLLAKNRDLFRSTVEPGAGGPKWERAESEVTDVTVAGDTLLAVSEAGGMSRFDAAGKRTARAGGAMSPIGRVADAGEIGLPGGGAALVLTDGNGLVGYDPAARRWSAHALKAVELHPLAGALVGRTDAGELKRIAWEDGALKVSDVNVGAPVRRVATGADGRFIAALADGRVVVGDGRAALRVVVGAALPDAARKGTVRDVAAVGRSLLLATSDGVYAHDDARGWQAVGGAGKVTKLASGGGVAFAQAEEPAGTLLRLIEKDGTWSAERVAAGVASWHAVADGVVAERDAKGGAETVFIRATGAAEVVFAPSAGPPDADVVGARVGAGRVWLRTKTGELWQADADAGRWAATDLGAADTLGALALGGDVPVVRTEKGALLIGRRTAPAAPWTFEKLDSAVTALDTRGPRLAYVTDAQLVARRLADEVGKASRPVRGRAWAEKGRLVAAAADGPTLWAASDTNAVSSYDASKGQWVKHPVAPRAVKQLAAVGGSAYALGADGKWAALDAGRWVDEAARGGDAFELAGTRYRVAGGRLVIGDEAPAEPARLPDARPARLATTPDSLWLEFEDGSLWRYAYRDRRFARLAAARTEGATRTGLVTAGGATVFLAEDLESYVRLADGAAALVAVPGVLKLPDVAVTPEGLLVTYGDRGALLGAERVEDDLAAARLTDLRTRAEAPAADRLRSSADWKLDGDARKLTFRSGTAWHEVKLDAARAALAWDAVTAGLAWQNTVVLATDAGVVVHPPGLTGKPVAFYPLPSGLTVWATKADRVFAAAADGGFWHVPLKAEATAAATPGPWRVTAGPALGLVVGAAPVRVTLDDAGLLGLDDVRGVALTDDAVFVATRDGLCEFTADLSRLKAVPVPGTIERLVGGERPLAGTEAGKTWEFDGKTWQESNTDATAATLGQQLRDRPATGPLRVGTAEYGARGFVHDTPTPATGELGVTSDGKRVYVATAAGLVVRDAGGKLTATLKVEGGATGLRWSADGAAPLLVRGGDKVFALGANGLAEKTAAEWDAARLRPLTWNGARVTPTVSPDRGSVELQADAKQPPVVLDLAAGGFRHDQADAVAIAGAAWVAYPGHVRRIALAPNGARESFPLGAADQTPALRRVGARVFALVGGDAYPLDDRDPPAAKPTPDAVPGGFTGTHWRVDGGKVAVKAGTAWNDTGFDPKRGFVADAPRRVAVAGKTLVVAPEGGPAFCADLPAAGLPALADLVPVAGTDGRPARIDDLRAAGDVVFAGGDGWFRLAGTPPRWQVEGPDQPRALADATAELGGSAAARWRRVGDDVHLIEPGPGGADTESVLRTERFEFDHVRAAAETAAGVWLATDAGLWLADAQGGAWKPVRPDARGDAAFRRQGADWFFRVQPKGAADRVFRLDGEAARPVTDDAHPFREPEVLVDNKGGLRATRRDGKLSFEVPKAGGGSHPVAYLPDQGRFDFQVVTDVGGDGKHLLTATPAGVVAWDFAAGQAWLAGVRTDLKELPEPTVQDESARWQCRREGAAAPAIHTQFRAGGPWVELPLHAEGGFDYHRATKVIPGAAGGAWTASGRTLVRHTGGAGPWVPDAVWRAAQIGADGDITDVFTTDAGVSVVIGGRVFTQNGNEWQPAENGAELLRRRAALAASTASVWEKADGALRLTRRLAGGGSLEQTFDAQARRFPADVVRDDAALWDGAVWLTTPAGVVRIVAETRQTAGLLKADGAAWTSLQFDRDANKLLAVGGTGVVLAGTGNEPPTAAGPAAPERLARLAGAAYTDADWRFTAGPAPTLTWRGLTSGVRDGRFAHDTFTRLFVAERALWTATPVGLIRHDLRPAGIAVAEVLPLPPNEPAVEVMSAGAVVRCAAPRGKAYDWDREAKAWKAVPDADPARERVLLDTPFWTWTRDAAGKAFARVKPADAGPADVEVRADGRFAFDGAAASLADPDGAWLAGFEGVVRVGPDGGVRHWFQVGVRDGQTAPLGAVVRLGRFDGRGDPLPSSAPPERLAGSAVFAADDKGGAWRYEPGSPGRWVAVAANPWGAARGGWVVRTSVFGAWEDEKGAVKLRHVTSGADGPAGPVLRGGRFLADVTRSIAFSPDAGYAATHAGVVEFDPQTARPRRLWRGAGGGGDLSACAEVFAHSGNGRLHAAGPGAEVYARDGAAWAPVRADDEFRASADVLHRDGFWVWHRWAGRADARVTAADPAPPGWPLFTDGRFSFDVLLDVRVGSDVRATTAGGVARFRASDLAPEWLDRTATEADGGHLVPLTTAVRFVDAGGDVCEGGGRRFTRGGGRWAAVRAPAEGESVTVATDGPRSWRVSPVVGDAGGFEVTLTEGGAVVWRGRALRGTPPDQLRAAVAAKGRLWLCLDRGVYRVTP